MHHFVHLRPLRVGLVILATSVLQLAALDQVQASSGGAVVLDANPGLASVTLELEGMHCAGCVLKIRTALKTLVGVESFREGSTKKRLIVDYTPDQITPAAMVEKVKEAGYGATVIKKGK